MKRFFQKRLSSLRARMLACFVIGMGAVLVSASVLTYGTTYEVIEQINHRNASTELALVSGAIDNVHNNLLRQMNTITSAPYFDTLANRARYTELDIIFAIRSFYADVSAITINFPFIHSVYMVLDSDYVLCATGRNMQRFVAMQTASPTLQRLIDASQERRLSYTGGVNSLALPFIAARGEQRYDLVSASRRYGNTVVIMNCYAEDVTALSMGEIDSQESVFRVLNPRGAVVFSSVAGEAGGQYQHMGVLAEAAEGTHTVDELRTQLVWSTTPDAGLKVMSEMDTGVYWKSLNRIKNRMLAILLVGFLATGVVFWVFLGHAFRPFQSLRDSMARAGSGDYSGVLPVRGWGEMRMLTKSYNSMLGEISSLTERNARAEREKRETELRALRNQINPHFLFNTLNTIRWMCVAEGNAKAAECLKTLGAVLKPLFRSDQPYSTLREEIESVRRYVYIMNLRLGGDIVLREEVAAEVENLRVLRLLLQPIVENAIMHGFEEKGGTITVSANAIETAAGKALEIRVSNDGRQIPPDQLAKIEATLRSDEEDRGVGLINTARRLYLQYGRDSSGTYGISLSNQAGGGVCVRLVLPYDEGTPEEQLS